MLKPDDLDKFYHVLCDIRDEIKDTNKILLLRENKDVPSVKDELYKMYVEKFTGVKFKE